MLDGMPFEPTFAHALTFALRQSTDRLLPFVADLDHGQLHHRPVAGANCAAWILGHVISVERHAMLRLGLAEEKDLPPLPREDFDAWFGRDADAAGREDYGDVAGLPGVFKQHREVMISAVERGGDELCARPLPRPTPRGDTVGELLLFFTIHVSLHAGHLSTIRRSLGLPPLV